jgi:putative photosynthetic complex assembly protein
MTSLVAKFFSVSSTGSDASENKVFERLPMVPIALVLASVISMIAIARTNGLRPEQSLPHEAALAQRLLHFEDASHGSVIVRDAKTGVVIQQFASGEGAFLRATLRALVNDRKKKGIKTTDDFRLEVHKGPQLFLIDQASGRTISLNAFGPTNTAVFAALMSNQKGEGL